MNKIEKMLKEMCPNGVEYKKIWELTAWDKLFNNMDRSMQTKVIKYPYLLASDMFALEVENGNVKLLSTGTREGWTTEELAGENLCEGEVVAMPWGGTPNIKYYKGKFVTADNRIATSLDVDKLSNKFLYYIMQNRIDEISSFYRGSGIKHPDMFKVLNMEIPVPPIEVQREIVRILDNFTELTAELTAEREARVKQYEYYRDKLLNVDGAENEGLCRGEAENCRGEASRARIVKLKEIVEFKNGKGHEKNIVENGKFVVVNSKFVSTEGQVKKYSNEQLTPLFKDEITLVMSDLPNGRALGKCFLIDADDKYTLNQRICALKCIDENISTKYLFYIVNRNKQLLKYDNGVDQTNLSKENILSIELNIPNIEIQNRIVHVLDHFESICSDLNIGLPAEIEARKKQYEYYRDALLNFAETGNVDFVEREREREREVALYKLIQYVWGYVKVTIGDICEITRGRVLSKDYIRDNVGIYPVYSSQTENNGELGKIQTYDFDGEYVTWTTDGANAGSVFYRNGKFSVTNVCGLLKVKNSNLISHKYLYYILSQETKKYVNSGMGNPKLMNNVMERITISVPSLEKQQKIVNTLDQLDTLCNDLTSGLPAEIEARKKQYEYYRDKLLTFN